MTTRILCFCVVALGVGCHSRSMRDELISLPYPGERGVDTSLERLESLPLTTTGVSMRRQSLAVLPEGLSRFKDLEIIDLSKNNINSSVSNFRIIPEFKKLRAVILNMNAISDIAPLVKTLSVCTNLVQLDLWMNGIEKIPAEVGELPRLIELDLNYNKLREFPKVLEANCRIKVLGLGANGIAELPDLRKMVGLRDLDLSLNPLRTIKPEYLPPHLRTLNLIGCPLEDKDSLMRLLAKKYPKMDVCSDTFTITQAEMEGSVLGRQVLWSMNQGRYRGK